MNTSSISRLRTSITAAQRQRAHKRTESASASIALSWMNSIGSRSARRSITRSTSYRPILMLGCSNTTIVDRIRAVGVSARPRCRPSLTQFHWRGRNSWLLDHDRQIHRSDSQPTVRSSLSYYIEIVENGAPRRAGLAAHVLDGQQHFLTVLAHAEHDQEHDRGGLPVEPDPHHGAIQDQADDRLLGQRAGIPGIPITFHLPPHPAHRIFADRAAKDGRDGPPHPTRIRSEERRVGKE